MLEEQPYSKVYLFYIVPSLFRFVCFLRYFICLHMSNMLSLSRSRRAHRIAIMIAARVEHKVRTANNHSKRLFFYFEKL